MAESRSGSSDSPTVTGTLMGAGHVAGSASEPRFTQTHINNNIITEILFNGVNIWNSLPKYVVSANTTNVFQNRLDKFWQGQEIIYDFKAQIERRNWKSKWSRVTNLKV